MSIPRSLPSSSSSGAQITQQSELWKKQALKIAAVALLTIAAIASFVFFPWPVGVTFSLLALVMVSWLLADCPRIDSARFFSHHNTGTSQSLWHSFSFWAPSDYHHSSLGHRTRVGDPYDTPILRPLWEVRKEASPPRPSLSRTTFNPNIHRSNQTDNFMSSRIPVGGGQPPCLNPSPPSNANLAGRPVVPNPDKESKAANAAHQSMPPNLPRPAASSRVVVGGVAGQAPPRLGPPQPHQSSYAPSPGAAPQPIPPPGLNQRVVVGGAVGQAPPRLGPPQSHSHQPSHAPSPGAAPQPMQPPGPNQRVVVGGAAGQAPPRLNPSQGQLPSGKRAPWES